MASVVVITGVSGAQNATTQPGVLHRVIASNSDNSSHTVEVLDGTRSLGVFPIAAGATVPLEFSGYTQPTGSAPGVPAGFPIVTKISINPSDAHISATVIHD